MELRYLLMRHMASEGLSESTILLYRRIYEKINIDVGIIEGRGNHFWIDYLASIIKDPMNRNNYRSTILKICRDVLGENILLPKIKRPTRLQPIYNIEDVSKIFSKIKNPKHYAIATLLFTESLRVDEALSIRLADCIKEENAIIIRGTKNKRDYKKYLDIVTVESIKKYFIWAKGRNQKPNVLLFEGWGNEKYSSTSVRNFMKKAMKLAGVEVKGACHIFRRSASVWKIENGWGVNHLAASLNNSPRTASKYYALVRPDYLKTLPKPVV